MNTVKSLISQKLVCTVNYESFRCNSSDLTNAEFRPSVQIGENEDTLSAMKPLSLQSCLATFPVPRNARKSPYRSSYHLVRLLKHVIMDSREQGGLPQQILKMTVWLHRKLKADLYCRERAPRSPHNYSETLLPSYGNKSSI